MSTDFFSELSNFIQTHAWVSSLLGVVIGGIITVITTNCVERGKEKREMSRTKMEKVLIPYCTDLETVIKKIEQIIKLSESKPHESGLIVFERVPERIEIIETLQKPLQYLDAAKRVYLPKAARAMLEEYKQKLQSFDELWDHNCDRIKNSFESWMEGAIKDFDHSLGYEGLLHSISYKMVFDSHLDKSVITMKSFDIMSDLRSIMFIEEPDGETHTFSLDVPINSALITKHEAGDIDPSDDYEKISFNLLDHLDCKRWDGMEAEVKKYTIKKDLNNILCFLKRIQKDMIKRIDYIM